MESTPALSTALLSTLSFALSFELLELFFYQQMTGTATSAPSASFLALTPAQQAGLKIIGSDEQNHVNFLTGLFTGTTTSAPSMSSMRIDLTANSIFPDIYTNPATLLLAAQVLEDTSVRYYKGQLARLASNQTLLTYFLDLHSVEARHAGYIRIIRNASGINIKPWITLSGNMAEGTSINPVIITENANLLNVYLNEDNTFQAQIQIQGINGHTEITNIAASESFDEVLSQTEVLAILGSFITSGI